MVELYDESMSLVQLFMAHFFHFFVFLLCDASS